MAELQDVVDRHRDDLRKREVQAVQRMTRAYTEIEEQLVRDARLILDSLGPNTTISKFLRLRRTRDLLRQIETILGEHADQVIRPAVMQLTEEALIAAQSHTDELIRAAMGPAPRGAFLPIAHLSEGAVQNIVAATADGPLARLIAGFGAEAAEKARRALLLGIARGEHPTKIARRLRDSLQVSNTRAALIARTETLRAYRESTRATYQANSRVVEKWIWCASFSGRTCAACWAMSGSEHDLSEPMASHPACRCSMVPKVKRWRDLGYPDANETQPTLENGADAFARQPASIQQKVLGPKAYDAYRKGDVELKDFIHVDHSPEWGDTIRRGSLANALR